MARFFRYLGPNEQPRYLPIRADYEYCIEKRVVDLDNGEAFCLCVETPRLVVLSYFPFENYADVALGMLMRLVVRPRVKIIDVQRIMYDVYHMAVRGSVKAEDTEAYADPEPCQDGIAGVVHECRCRMNGGES